MRGRQVWWFLFCVSLTVPDAAHGQTATESQKTGAELYRSACATCHGPDGKGAPQPIVGFETPLPDFTDCRFATPEADADWLAVMHDGGRARAFDRMMPAFADALSRQELTAILAHVRSLCAEPGWPRGDLNLPRALVTEKAFPENEAVLTVAVTTAGNGGLENEFLYERRVGRRGQWEVVVPLGAQQDETGRWRRGLGDLAAAYKHVLFDSLTRGSIVSGGAELVFPTGKENEGLGGGRTVVETFGTMSQLLPRDGFLHLHGGFEFPVSAEEASTEGFWRAAVGRTWIRGRWGRAWSPMFELLGARELKRGERAEWDILPQMQVSLSTRQHILINAGVRVPVNQRHERSTSLVFYLLWDWFDGGLFSGW